MKLFGLGKDFVSRSEARRLLSGLEACREVVVDFRDVDGVGQGFTDEMFRVWANRYPETRLVPVNTVEPLQFFVERTERKRQSDGSRGAARSWSSASYFFICSSASANATPICAMVFAHPK